MGLFRTLFPSHNDRELKKLGKIADRIEALEPQFQAMTDEELRACTQSYRDRIAQGEDLDKLLPEAFATVREASKRVLNMRHFRVQLIGGIVLHQGRIAEMRTGEGKTLVATLAAYLNALPGKGMHIVTVNDYLARRDAEWMGKIFRFLGLTVGVNVAQMTPQEKQQAYACDILYSTNNELGFDYLRDNMVKKKESRVQRELHFAIVDEVDSILIDEARTPLIISGRGNKSSEGYVLANRFVKNLKGEYYVCPECGKQVVADKDDNGNVVCADCGVACENRSDYELSEKDKTVFLNENGAAKAEEYFHIENLADYENQELKHYIDNALRANYIMRRETDYLVRDGEVVIVDEFTGREMIGRRYSGGLHQAIEAKENVTVRSEDKTLATITFQNFFRLYRKISGMTGTAKTEETEFESIYKLDVVVIPTNKPIVRRDEQDKLYVNEDAKYRAIIRDVMECHERKQPVLVGTVSVEKSEKLSAALKKYKVPHKVLNAKNHALEAEIVAQAGQVGAVTIATNMAGRGTDILLGGNPEFLAKRKLESLGYAHDAIETAASFFHTDDEQILKAREEYRKYYDLFAKDTEAEKQQVVSLGGLRIIGTERHESRRIDNQLRGRSGRQGDPGSSVFYLAMDDDMMRRFGGEQMQAIVSRLALDPDEAIQAKILTNRIEAAQARCEDRNFSIRKHVLGYDDVMNRQREIIYSQRKIVLDELRVHEQILAMIKGVIERIVPKYVDYKEDHRNWDYEQFNRELEEVVLEAGTQLMTPQYVEDHSTEQDMADGVYETACAQYEAKIARAQQEIGMDFELFERDCMLYNVDSKWMEHIDAMSELKQGIGLVAYAQRDPVLVYKKEGFDMFYDMIEKIQYDTVRVLVKSHFEKKTETASREERNVRTNNPGQTVETVKRDGKKIGRNDPCPCGSGKKYKQCCGRNG